MDKRNIGQSAIEFIVLVGVLLLIFIIILAISFGNTITLNKNRETLVGETIVTKVQKEINLAARVLDGYSREFQLPEKLGSKDYTIFVANNRVVVQIDNRDYWRAIPPVVGTVQKSLNRINKTNGTIYLN